MKRYPARNGRGAFTLVEMLVAMVIAMIIILLTSFAWRGASQVVARTDALLRAHQKAGALMSTFRNAAEQSTVTLPMVVENQLLVNDGPNLAFFFSDGAVTTSEGGTNTVRDTSLPKINEGTIEKPKWNHPKAIWGIGMFDMDHPEYYGKDSKGDIFLSEGKEVRRSDQYMYDLATVGFRFRWTRYTKETGLDTGMAATYEAATTQANAAGLVPGGHWQANYPFFYRRSLTPISQFPVENMKFAYRSLTGDPSHHDNSTSPDSPHVDDLIYGYTPRPLHLQTNFSGSTEPDWPTRYGDTVSDGEIVWQTVAPTLWFIKDTAHLVSMASPAGSDEIYVNFPLRGSFNQFRSHATSKYGTLTEGARSPFAHGIGRFQMEWDTSINNIKPHFDDGHLYRNLDIQKEDESYDPRIGDAICQGFVGNDPRGDEPLYQPRFLKLNFNVVEIPTGTIGEAVVQDFSVRAWIR